MTKHIVVRGSWVSLVVLALYFAALASGASSVNTTTNTSAKSTKPVNASFLSQQQCPFSLWGGSERNCYECRWCPFRRESCCEVKDEIQILKQLQVSGHEHWDCFITIAHYQECGKCSPKSQLFRVDKNLTYAPNALGWSVRICREACGYIYKRCKAARLLNGGLMIPEHMSVDEFCKNAPVASTDDVPCFNSAKVTGWCDHNILVRMFLAVMITITLLF